MSGSERRSSVNQPEDVNQKERFFLPYDKIVDKKAALEQIRTWQAAGLSVVIVDAVLDIPHYKHADYFLACANLGEKLAVRIATDELIKAKKNPQGTIMSWDQRVKHATHYPYIDLIFPKDDNSWDWVETFRPNMVAISTTSPVFIVEMALEELPYLEKMGIELIAMDELANQIPVDSLYAQAVAYNKDPLSKEKLSGSIIKRKIRERAKKQQSK